ncbi:hypothetical protein HF521_017086 [Silurus meridionalis]|uniref:Rab11 family-interacting protein 3 n=2 Tax=Silurus meridionalis TaxID=175797 RepID=A0A8T0BLQ2_SILME|nr:hypothetical protein HF521_017086 [Silurus meridionalis]
MEQVLSSPRGHSDWESDQNSLGFLLLDNDVKSGGRDNPDGRQVRDPSGLVSLSFDEIFQDGSLNLDELFRASRYSALDQTYPWECGPDRVGSTWDKPQRLPQKPDEGGETAQDAVAGDLITFHSGAPSPSHVCTSTRVVENLQPNTTHPLDDLVDDEFSGIAKPEEVTDSWCSSVPDLVEGNQSRIASCNFENSHEDPFPSPIVNDSSSSPHGSVSHPDLLASESRVLLELETGLSSEQERDIALFSNTKSDDASEVRSSPRSPTRSLPSSATPDKRARENEIEHVMDRDVSPDEQEPGSDFAQAVLLLPSCVPEQAPVESTSTSLVSDSHTDGSKTSRDSRSGDIFHNQKETIVDTFPALEVEPPLVSPPVCTLNADSETNTISHDSQTSSGSSQSSSSSGEEQTIDVFAHTLAAMDTRLVLHEQEPCSVTRTPRHCQDPSGCTCDTTQEPNTHDASERSSETCDLQVPLKDNTPLCAPGGSKPEFLCVQEKESECTYISENLPAALNSSPCSGAGKVGVAIEQERGEATSRLGLSADVRLDGETDLLDPADPSQVADSVSGGDGPPREPCPPPMEDDILVVPDAPDDVEMALELCVSSDAIQDGCAGAGADPADVPQDYERSALRAVFQALDQDGDGFVRIEEFMEFATAYGVEQVKDLTRFLDPSGLGVISFEDFHRGITAISNGGSDPDLYKLQLTSGDANGAAEEYDEQAEVSDSAYLGSESAYSECETFTDEDTGALVHPELHEDVETDSGIENTLAESEDRNRFSLGSDLHGHALVAVIGGEEEHFEDFGESNSTSDLLLANQEEGRVAPEGEGDPEPHPHTGSPVHRPPMLLSPSSEPFPSSFQNFLQSESLEFFCTHCHKQISRLEDLSTRLHLLEMNSSSKRLSSKKAARHLLQSSGLDGMSDLSRDFLDLADSDITDKVLLLERRVSELEKDSAASEEQHARLRQENLALVHRANALEEQLKEQELHSDETLNTLARKHRDALSKLQRERELEIENLQARLHQLDEENSELRSCVPCLRANIERLEEEKRKLQDEMDDVSDRLNEETESRRKMADKLSHERHTSQKEKETTQELIEDLRKQLEMLQLFKLETEARRGRSPAAGLQEYNTHMRENELEQEIRRLKQDNRSLKEQNDELNGQIINLSIQGAKSLFTESLSESLAAEINNVSRAELMEAIQKQEEINFRLQDYIDRIIVAIMESNPSILEVK